MNRRRPFSLVELLVCFLLLSFLVTVAGIKIKDAIMSARFQAGHAFLVDKLAFAKRLAKMTSGGIKLTIEKQHQDLVLSLDGDALPSSHIKQVMNKKELLPGVAAVHLSTYDLPLELTFYSNGLCYYDGVPVRDDMELEVIPSLSNRPLRIITLVQPTDQALVKEGGDLYPHECKKKS